MVAGPPDPNPENPARRPRKSAHWQLHTGRQRRTATIGRLPSSYHSSTPLMIRNAAKITITMTVAETTPKQQNAIRRPHAPTGARHPMMLAMTSSPGISAIMQHSTKKFHILLLDSM
jgi:hypothetical protein